ncbi:putative RTX toxin [hydrothermal vent metagenome]|uniref:Putative RTX toxin n=1 Tax=hydrothermal vent metagenome TaxID=652676 RepID=A0A1W1D1S5_9ZZZZ
MKNILQKTLILSTTVLLINCADDIEIPASLTAPVAKDDNATVSSGSSTTIKVLSNDSPSENRVLDTSSIIITTDVKEGATVVNSNGTVTYTSDGVFTGTETFLYTVKDTNGTTSNKATVRVTISTDTTATDTTATNTTATNTTATDTKEEVVVTKTAPKAINDSSSTTQGTAITISLLDNDIDNGDGLNKITIIQDTKNGTVILNANGTATYTSTSTFTGTDTFTYQVSDRNGLNSNTATVTITVT